MAGIKLLDKNAVTLNYIVNHLLNPEIREKVFDDIYGLTEIAFVLFDGRTRIYGIMEQGKPEPVGVVFFTNVTPYRDCTLFAVVFDPAKRGKGLLQSVLEAIQKDLVRRTRVHSITTYVIDGNEASHHLLTKAGFTKLEPARKKAICAGGEYRDLYTYYRLLEESGKEG